MCLISDDLRLSPHIEHVTGKANRVVELLRRNLKECPKELREIAYFFMVLQYATTVCDPT